MKKLLFRIFNPPPRFGRCERVEIKPGDMLVLHTENSFMTQAAHDDFVARITSKLPPGCRVLIVGHRDRVTIVGNAGPLIVPQTK